MRTGFDCEVYIKEQSASILERNGIEVYTHGYTEGYPTDVDLIVSDQGYGANPYIEQEAHCCGKRSGAWQWKTGHLSE